MFPRAGFLFVICVSSTIVYTFCVALLDHVTIIVLNQIACNLGAVVAWCIIPSVLIEAFGEVNFVILWGIIQVIETKETHRHCHYISPIFNDNFKDHRISRNPVDRFEGHHRVKKTKSYEITGEIWNIRFDFIVSIVHAAYLTSSGAMASISSVQSMMCANNQVRYGLGFVFECLHITLSHCHHYVDSPEGIESIKRLSAIFCQVCV